MAGVQSDDHVTPDKALQETPSSTSPRCVGHGSPVRTGVDQSTTPRGTPGSTIERLSAWLKTQGVLTSWRRARTRRRARLRYIGMTRASEELCVSYYGESRLIEELERILERCRQS